MRVEATERDRPGESSVAYAITECGRVLVPDSYELNPEDDASWLQIWDDLPPTSAVIRVLITTNERRWRPIYLPAFQSEAQTRGVEHLLNIFGLSLMLGVRVE